MEGLDIREIYKPQIQSASFQKFVVCLRRAGVVEV